MEKVMWLVLGATVMVASCAPTGANGPGWLPA